MVESPRIEVNSVPCGFAWGADATLFVDEADMEGMVESPSVEVYSVPCGLTWGADEAQTGMKAFALWGFTDWASRCERL